MDDGEGNYKEYSPMDIPSVIPLMREGGITAITPGIGVDKDISVGGVKPTAGDVQPKTRTDEEPERSYQEGLDDVKPPVKMWIDEEADSSDLESSLGDDPDEMPFIGTVEEATPRNMLKVEKDTDPSDGKFFQKKGRGYYQTDGKKGYLLILNFSKGRNYTDFDVSSLKSFFKGELKFDVNSPRDDLDDDLTTEELEVCLKDIRTRLSNDYKKYYCFVCAILSHGNKGAIKTRDGKLEIEIIMQMFGNKHMDSFAGKPKIFFVQACQGADTQTSVKPNDETDDDANDSTREEIDESDVLVAIPNDADVLVAYATTPGFKAHRRETVGSWFIAECISVFTELKEHCHLEEMLVTVRERVALDWDTKNKGKQMPCTWSTLTKRLRLS